MGVVKFTKLVCFLKQGVFTSAPGIVISPRSRNDLFRRRRFSLISSNRFQARVHFSESVRKCLDPEPLFVAAFISMDVREPVWL